MNFSWLLLNNQLLFSIKFKISPNITILILSTQLAQFNHLVRGFTFPTTWCRHCWPCLHYQGIQGSINTVPLILNPDNVWRWEVNFMHQPLYAQGKNPGTYWIGGWVGPSTVWRFGIKKNRLPLPGIKSQIVYYTPALLKVTLRNNIKSEPNKILPQVSLLEQYFLYV
jgi:hypothetical protein